MPEKTHPEDAKALEALLDELRKEHVSPYSWIAGQIGISRQAVWAWSAVPLRFVAKLEKATGVPRNRLLPHAFKKYQDVINAE